MGRSACYDKAGLKKGPWTPEEDGKLLAYIQEHGHHSWRTIPSKAGLERCGKSCRLRWTNYLRPDIKRGKFSLQEEQTIIQLHALLGNRWSTIANHLPKRTDNEIKNYWNTHLKKRLTRMGIDPITHKPRNHALGSAQSKDFSNLCHTAQWESARLQAEARLVRESKLLSDPDPFLTAAAVGAPQPLPPRPPCLDVLQVWVQTNTELDVLNLRFQTGTDLHARSHIPSSDGVYNPGVPKSKTSTSNLEMPKMWSADQPNLNCHQEEVRGIMENSIELQDMMMNPVGPTHAGFPSFMEGFGDVPPSIVSVEACWNVPEDNNNYWGNFP